MVSERSPLIPGIQRDVILDASTDLPGFVASELEQEELNKTRSEDVGHGAVPAAPEDQETGISSARTTVILLSMYLGVFLSALDSTIVTTLIGKIASEFNALPKLSWIATSYLVSSSTFQPLYGKLSDIFGRRALLLFCNTSFAIGCFICYLAPDVNWLILGRFISGAGGSGLSSLTTITTSDLIPLKDRGIYQGLSNVAFGLGTAVGGTIGGIFADHPSLGGWRGAFLIQVPLTLASALAIQTFLILPQGSIGLGVSGNNIIKKLKQIDWFGSLSLVSFLLFFLTGASFGGKEFPFNSWQFIWISIGTLASFLAFLIIELRVENPTLPLRFLSMPTVTGVSLSNFFACVSSFTTYFMVPIYYTAVLNLNSTEIGQRFSPNFFSIIFGSLGAGYYMKSTGKYRNMLLVAGLFAIFGTYRVVKLNPSYTTFEQYILFITPGVGFAIIITATLLALIAAVPHEHQAATTSISYLFRSCGSTLGVSIASAMFSKKLESELVENVLKFKDEYDSDYLLGIVDEAIHSSQYVQNGAPKFIKSTLVEAYATSTKLTFKFSFVACILAFLSLMLIKEHTLHSSMKR